MIKISIEDMATFCKKKGFVYRNSDIYGGLAGFWDFGYLGSELKKNLKDLWWKFFVQSREDVVGIDGTTITHPKVWEASGHVSSFEDLMLTCKKCKEKVRADTFLEQELKIAADGMKAKEVNDSVKKNNLKCPNCKGDFEEVQGFNLMFKTNVGPVEDSSSIAYLRPETAQLMFTNFKLTVDNARLKLPFGIAQMGRAYRNEISPRDFLFRCREFEQMEIEYFIHPDKLNDCPYIDEVLDHDIQVYSADMQVCKKDMKKMTMKQALDKKIIKTTWHAYWLAKNHKWFIDLGAKPDNFRIRQHIDTEKSHYALDTWDLEYNFPFGWKELQGIANRTDFDLTQHIKHSKQDLTIFDEETKKKITPYVVAEPSLGVDRSFLVFMFDAYSTKKDEKGNDVVVLKLHPQLAPIKVAILPLVKKLNDKAREVYELFKKDFTCFFDSKGSIGRRYIRQDEIGTFLCCTVDFQSLEDGSVTLRERNTTRQIRVKAEEIKKTIQKLLNGEKFEKCGDLI